MTDTSTSTTTASPATAFDGLAGHFARYGLVVVIGWIGLMKFTSFEAYGIEPLVANSPLMSWVYGIFSVTMFSALLGVVEVAAAVLLAVKPWAPRLSAIGSVIAIGLFVATTHLPFQHPRCVRGVAGRLPDAVHIGTVPHQRRGPAGHLALDAHRRAAFGQDRRLSGYAVAEMTTTASDETALIAGLRAGDEAVYAELVDRHTPSMLRVARGYVRTNAVAEEVVQEAWIALLKGIAKFEGRSSLRTWLFTVLVNIAKARALRERRNAEVEVMAFTGGSVDPARFRSADDRWPGHWREDASPAPFPDTPEGSVLGDELIAVARAELEKLPERQRIVVTMRDMLGLDSAEVRELLDISVANQRVLLHRGRSAVRQVLEDYLKDPK